MKGMVRWVKDKAAYAIAGTVGALTVFILDHYEHIIADVQEYITGPVIGMILTSIKDRLRFNKIVEQPAGSVEDHIEPEKRFKAEDDAITANEQLQKQTEIQAKIERLLGAVDGADRIIIHKFQMII